MSELQITPAGGEIRDLTGKAIYLTSKFRRVHEDKSKLYLKRTDSLAESVKSTNYDVQPALKEISPEEIGIVNITDEDQQENDENQNSSVSSNDDADDSDIPRLNLDHDDDLEIIKRYENYRFILVPDLEDPEEKEENEEENEKENEKENEEENEEGIDETKNVAEKESLDLSFILEDILDKVFKTVEDTKLLDTIDKYVWIKETSDKATEFVSPFRRSIGCMVKFHETKCLCPVAVSLAKYSFQNITSTELDAHRFSTGFSYLKINIDQWNMVLIPKEACSFQRSLITIPCISNYIQNIPTESSSAFTMCNLMEENSGDWFETQVEREIIIETRGFKMHLKVGSSTKISIAYGRSDNEGGEVRGRSRNTRREDPRRHTLGADQQYLAMAGQGGPLSRTMDLEGQPRGYPPPSNAMLFDDDPGIMSEVETSSTGFRRGGKQRSSLPVVRTPSKTLERPLGLVFLQYRNETKRALLPNEITSIDTVKALFVRSFPKQLTMEYLDSPNVKIYIHDSSKDMFYELEDLRSHLREIRDRSVLRLFESADVSGGLPMAGIGIAGGVGHFEDPSYFSEPEFDSEYQHQHIHKSKGSTGKGAPYYMGSTASLPRGATLLRTYSPAISSISAERMKPLPTDGYMSSPERSSRYEDPYYSQYATRSGSITPVIDEEISFSDTELLDDSYTLYGVKLPPGGGSRGGPRSPFPQPASGPPYDATRLRVENMERQLANLTGLVQKALTQPAPTHLQVPGRDNYRDDSYLRSDSKAPKLGKGGCHKSVSFEKSVSFSDEPPDMNSPKQHSPQHAADTKPAKPAIKSSTLPRTSSQERDRLKPAPPPKPSALSPGQYDSRVYRDLQLTAEMYNQLRGLQKKAKELRAEVRNLRRMSQAQAHSVKETIRDTFIKIRAMLLAGGEQVWQAGVDQERVRLNREEDLYKQEMLRLETDLSDLESTVEELRGNVINRKTRVNMSDVENMALILSKSSKTVADLKLRFPGLQDGMKTVLSTEMEKVMREEKFLKEEPERLESALRRCKKLTGTLVTLKRLASVQEQRLPCANSGDGRLSPTSTETPPVTPSSTHSKPPTAPRVGALLVGGDGSPSDGNQRPENALDALLDELQTFSKPHPIAQPPDDHQHHEQPPPAIPAKGNRPPQISDIGRKGSMDSASFLPTQNLSVSTATGSLRRLHSYPSGSDTDNSPPIQPLQREPKTSSKPPIPERNAELLQHVAAGKRVPPPPPPRTSSKSPLASPTSPNLPPRSPAAGLQHIQNVQNMVEKPLSQFEQATQNLGLQTLRRNIPNRSSLKDKSQTLPRNIGSNLQVPAEAEVISASNSSSCESVNSQDGSKKTRKEELEQRHQELLKKQKALQDQYARLQQLQRGTNTLAIIPPAPDQLLKKTGSESNLLQKMGLQLATSQITGSLSNIPNTSASIVTKRILTNTNSNPINTNSNNVDEPSSKNGSSSSNSTNVQTNKVYETDIL